MKTKVLVSSTKIIKEVRLRDNVTSSFSFQNNITTYLHFLILNCMLKNHVRCKKVMVYVDRKYYSKTNILHIEMIYGLYYVDVMNYARLLQLVFGSIYFTLLEIKTTCISYNTTMDRYHLYIIDSFILFFTRSTEHADIIFGYYDFMLIDTRKKL